MSLFDSVHLGFTEEQISKNILWVLVRISYQGCFDMFPHLYFHETRKRKVSQMCLQMLPVSCSRTILCIYFVQCSE